MILWKRSTVISNHTIFNIITITFINISKNKTL